MKDLPQGPFDAIVIGSGIGSLTTAVLLAKLQHKRVLVLEQHFTLKTVVTPFRQHYFGEIRPLEAGQSRSMCV
jgi:2-polyprenyl-6-methoxyphenol hydroxylase-like FAD-dependent oxidoreductase